MVEVIDVVVKQEGRLAGAGIVIIKKMEIDSADLNSSRRIVLAMDGISSRTILDIESTSTMWQLGLLGLKP